MTRLGRDERGAALIFAIVFMVVIGAICGATLSTITSGLNDRTILDAVRNRQYAADAGVEAAIANARSAVTTWSNATNAAPPQNRLQTFLSSAQCGGTYSAPPLERPAVRIWVTCSPAPALHAGYFQFNVVFSACTDSGCSSGPIVRAQVNFEVSGGVVTRTYVQSWSVNA